MMAIAALILALIPLVMTLRNLREYTTPAPMAARAGVSVLIPARDEESHIAAACAAVFASTGVDWELIVLDDGSTDRTAAILEQIRHPRLRVYRAPALPAGWSGKTHACHLLAQRATRDWLVFVDADVRLAPDALSRMVGFMQRHEAALASSIPRQIMVSWGEKLLLPLIHFLLLGFLPMARMRRSLAPSLGAGCGQLVIAHRASYETVGGHAAIRDRLHDGLMLPRAFRRAGYSTLMFDATRFAHCRMYTGFRQVWEGLAKNATEGLATPMALPVWTLLLGGGHVLPLVLIVVAPTPAAWLAFGMGIATRMLLAWRFEQPLWPALSHPLGIAVLLVLQWFSLVRRWRGGRPTWRGRSYPACPGPSLGE